MTTFPHVRLTAQGSLGLSGGNEIWSCSVKYGVWESGDPTTLIAPTQSDVDECANEGVTDWSAFIPHAGSGALSGICSDLVLLEGVKAAAVLASGRDDPALTSTFVSAAPGVRGNAPSDTSVHPWATGSIPYSVALAATLRGATYSRGSAALGRFYIPVPAINLSTTGTAADALVNGQMTPAVTTRFSEQAAALITALNTIVLPSGHLAAIVNIGSSTDLAGIRWQKVDRVGVDNRPDTIRRRSNKIAGAGVVVTSV
uniref:Uncharacterized protein n=1 Tax=uncultured prokaryote TaxID=198431 RepID=A0A0H5Q3Q0_9ZZZZ|nr:hypothetical protein [uncultured prokaryote]